MGKEGAFLFPKFVAKRREIMSNVTDFRGHGIWRNEVVDDLGGIARFNEQLKAGNGGIVYFTHPRKSDPFRVAKELMDRCFAIKDRRITIPVAQHQHMAALNVFGKVEGVDTGHAIVTPHTMERNRNYLHPTQKIPLYKDVFISGVNAGTKFWDKKSRKRFKSAKENFDKRNSPLPEAWGVKSYLRSVIKGVPEGDVAVISAQGGRSEVLGVPPERNAIDPLFALLDKPSLENIPVAFVGVDPNPYNLPSKKDHLFSRDMSRLWFNETLTMGEIRDRATHEGITPAQFVFKKLGEVSRREYVDGSVAS